jgi:LmbE family N-acetylglucosaminyl deacetylase
VTTQTPKIEPEGWEEEQKILVILAHPDDPDFFCGATLARWASMGHHIQYCLLTRGDKGVRDTIVNPKELAATREIEQKNAAAVLGVKQVDFLDFEDGYLVPDLNARKLVARVIRQVRPDVVVGCDPTHVFGENNINHPDHRAAGQIVVDAVFPAAGNPLYFPELLNDEGLEPCGVKEVWLTVTSQANTTVDVTEYWPKKIEALHCHETQISDMNQLDERLRSRHTPDSSPENPRYEEKFRRFKFR